jgi:hypothetical protein
VKSADADAYLANFHARVIHDAWLEATTTYWLSRAQQLEAAAPRPKDFTGCATAADIAGQRARLAGAAQACRHRAGLVDTTQAELQATADDLATGYPDRAGDYAA